MALIFSLEFVVVIFRAVIIHFFSRNFLLLRELINKQRNRNTAKKNQTRKLNKRAKKRPSCFKKKNTGK